MAQAIRDQQMTPADELRGLLTSCEKRLANLAGHGAGVLELLEDLDRIADLWPQLEAAGLDLRPEAGRWETLQALVYRNAGRIVAGMRSLGGLQKVRQAQHSDGNAPPWWNLVEELTVRRLRRLRLALSIGGAVVVLGAVVILAINRLFPQDPKLKSSLASQSAGQLKIEQHADYQGAISDFSAAVMAKPDEPDAWLWLGATQQKLGDLQGAQTSFSTAQSLLGGDFKLRLARVPYFLAVNLLQEAEADIRAVLGQDPENPEAYYYLATIYEDEGNLQEAVTALQRVSDLAEARNKPDLTAMARYRMAMMLQALSAGSLVLPTPTP